MGYTTERAPIDAPASVEIGLGGAADDGGGGEDAIDGWPQLVGVDVGEHMAELGVVAHGRRDQRQVAKPHPRQQHLHLGAAGGADGEDHAFAGERANRLVERGRADGIDDGARALAASGCLDSLGERLSGYRRVRAKLQSMLSLVLIA